jgi:protein-S-isoprenylcysteine O-methyltransferase Ste14
LSLLICFRIGGEEKTLLKGLKGYATYRKKVKYRLLPGIW